jgi:transposase
MRKKGTKNKNYSPEYKISVIMDMRENHLGYRETARKYNLGNNECQGKNLARNWERIYLEEGEVGFYIERRGRTTKMDNPKKGRPRKKPLDKQIENDLIAENQRLKEEVEYLRAENAYIKKLSALIAAEEQKKSKKQK